MIMIIIDIIPLLLLSSSQLSQLLLLQWNQSVATTSKMKYITCDLFSNVF